MRGCQVQPVSINPFAHRSSRRHLDQGMGGKGYAYCGCCGGRVTFDGTKHNPEPVRSCACSSHQTSCVRCGRCPTHGRCAPQKCVHAPSSGYPESALTGLINAMIDPKG